MTQDELDKLTGRAKELAMVQHDDFWPHWPILPMIKRDRAAGDMEMDNCGLLIADRGPEIQPGNLIIGPQRGEPVEYASWDALLDVWTVD